MPQALSYIHVCNLIIFTASDINVTFVGKMSVAPASMGVGVGV